MNVKEIVKEITALPVKSHHNTLEEAIEWCKANKREDPYILVKREKGEIVKIIIH